MTDKPTEELTLARLLAAGRFVSASMNGSLNSDYDSEWAHAAIKGEIDDGVTVKQSLRDIKGMGGE